MRKSPAAIREYRIPRSLPERLTLSICTQKFYFIIQRNGDSVIQMPLYSCERTTHPQNQKTALLSKNRFLISCYLTLFTFMRRSRTRRHMETKKVMMK